MTFNSYFFVLNIIAFTSCVSGRPISSGKNTEVIEYITQHYQPDAKDLSTPFWIFKDKAWFKDSMAIEEIRELNIQEAANGKTTQEYIIRHYRFSDLRKRAVYEYISFSDTATLIRKYSYSDSVQVIGGWGFNYIRHLNYQGIVEKLPDTVIGDKDYKRTIISRYVNDLPYTIICYFRCDKKGTIFNMDPTLSKTIGCPLVKLYWSSPIKKGLHMSTEVNFLSDTLTVEEIKVFTAWGNNANDNPVIK